MSDDGWTDVVPENTGGWQDVPSALTEAPALNSGHKYSVDQMNQLNAGRAAILSNEAKFGGTGPQSPSTQEAMDKELQDQIAQYEKTGAKTKDGELKADILKRQLNITPNSAGASGEWQDVTPDNQDGWTDVTPDDHASTVPYILSQALSFPANLIGGGLKAVGSLADAIGGQVGAYDIGDTLIKAGAAVEDPTNIVPGTTQQDFANPTTAQKIGGMVASVPAMVATGGAAPALAAISGGWEQGTNLVDQGANTLQAMGGAMTGALTSYAAMKAPMDIGKWYGKMAMGVASNAGAGAVNDATMHAILSSNPALANQYQWNDPTKRLPEAIFGGAFGLGVHAMGAAADAAHAATMGRAYYGNIKDVLGQDNFLAPHIANLDTHLNTVLDGRQLYTPPEGVTPDEQLRTILAPTTDGTSHPDATVQNILDLVAQKFGDPHFVNKTTIDPQAGPTQLTPQQDAIGAYAGYLSQLARTIGLDKVPVVNYRGTPDQVPHAAQYNPVTDTIELSTAGSSSVLHEIEHAITAHAIDTYTDMKARGATPDNPQMASLMARVQGLDDVYQALKAAKTRQDPAWEIKLKNAEDNILAKRQAGETLTDTDPNVNTIRDLYGYKDLHEFASEFVSKPRFREELNNLKVSKEDIATMYPDRNDLYQARNFGQAVRDKFKLMTGAPIKGTVIDPIFSHLENIVHNTTPLTRTSTEHGRAAAAERATAEWGIKNGVKSGTEDDVIANGIMQRIKKMLNLSDSYQMFATRMQVEFPSSNTWRDFVNNQAHNIWINRTLFDKVLETNNEYNRLTNGEQRFTVFPNDIEDFIKRNAPDLVDQNGRVISAIKGKYDMTTFSQWFDTPQAFSMEKAKKLNIVGQSVKFVVDQGREYVALGNKLRSEALQHFQEYNALNRKDKLGLFQEILDMNTAAGRANLKTRNLQWATPDMLAERGLSPEQIKAYDGLTKGTDYLFSLMNQVRQRQGVPPLERVPGYMPHVFEGAYKVFVDMEDKNTGQKQTILVKGFSTRWGAMKHVNEVESGKFDTPDKKFSINYDPDSGHPYRIRGTEAQSSSFSSSMNDFMHSYLNQAKASPEVMAAIQRMETSAMLGINTHMLESSQVGGFIGDKGINNSILEKIGIGDPRNNKILTLYEDYAKSVVEYYRNALMMTEVVGPLTFSDSDITNPNRNYGELFKNVPAFRKWLADYSFNFMGHPLNHAEAIDAIPMRIFKYIGLDPYMGRTIVSFLRNTMSKVALRMNLGFYASNMFQHSMVVGLLDLAAAQRAIEGKPTPMAATTYAKVLKQYFGKSLDADQIAAKQWAQDNHILDENVEQAMQGKTLTPFGDFASTVTGGKINPVIEKFGRSISFLTAYTHFRDIYGDRNMALQAARHITDMTMVNYGRESRPLMFQNLGIVGKALSPFAVFRNAYINNMEMQIEMIAKNPTKLRAYVPFITAQAAFMSVAGAVGIMGFEEYNRLTDLINTLFPSLRLQHLDAILLKAHAPDFITFGGVSAATKLIPGMPGGANISGSMGAPEPTTILDSPLIQFAQSLIGIGGAMGEDALHALGLRYAPAPQEDYYKSLKRVTPTIVHGELEKEMRGPKMPDNVAWKAGSTEGYVTRTPEDWTSYLATGKYSLPEAKRRIAERQVADSNKLVTDSVKELVDVATDTAMGMANKMTVKDAAAAAMRLDPDMTLDEFNQAVWDAMVRRMTTVKQKAASTAESSKGWREYYQRRAMGQ